MISEANQSSTKRNKNLVENGFLDTTIAMERHTTGKQS